MYVGVYFPASAKKRADLLVREVKKAFGARLKNLSWMSEPTKKKALIKLRAMRVKIGHTTKLSFQLAFYNLHSSLQTVTPR